MFLISFFICSIFSLKQRKIFKKKRLSSNKIIYDPGFYKYHHKQLGNSEQISSNGDWYSAPPPYPDPKQPTKIPSSSDRHSLTLDGRYSSDKTYDFGFQYGYKY